MLFLKVNGSLGHEIDYVIEKQHDRGNTADTASQPVPVEYRWVCIYLPCKPCLLLPYLHSSALLKDSVNQLIELKKNTRLRFVKDDYKRQSVRQNS